MDHDKLLVNIKTKGAWRINLRPLEYNEKNIEQLLLCRTLIESCKVSLRGWDYPHLGLKQGESYFGGTFFASGCDWDNSYKEYWRMYQSGQFIHWKAIKEDWDPGFVKPNSYSTTGVPPANKFLEVLYTIYLFTEILEFTSRLATKGIFKGGVEITIELHDAKNRMLFFYDTGRGLYQDYICKNDVIKITRVITEQDIIGQSQEISLQLLKELFLQFNWVRFPAEAFQEEQLKLLKRK